MVRRWWRRAVVLVALLLAAICVLIGWFPARWAWALMAGDHPRIEIGGLSGSVWHGKASAVRMNDANLGDVSWHLSRAALFGHWRLRFAVNGERLTVSGRLKRTGEHAVRVDDLDFSVPVSRFASIWPETLAPSGTLTGAVHTLRIKDGWPTRLDADVTWKSAAGRYAGQQPGLGTVRSHWQSGSARVVNATLRTTHTSPVALDGDVTITAFGWRLNATLQAPSDDGALRQWLAQVGQREAGGQYRVVRHGGLATTEQIRDD